MYTPIAIPDHWKWFPEARYGMFIHWGPYAAIGRGEQVLFRDHMNPAEYEQAACQWNPTEFDARRWARLARQSGMKYACLTTRHHDGYCLWDSTLTDYTSFKQAPRRDFVAEYAEAFRAEGLRVGLYYSWLDWRVPAFFDGPEKDPEGFAHMKAYMHGQVEELLTRYGQIDYFFFDGSWPRSREELGSVELLANMRKWQPGIMVNNRLGYAGNISGNEEDVGADAHLGDFGTPERQISAERHRLWESCDVSTWRLWGYAPGEHFKPAEQWLDLLCECAEKGGNLLMNIAPDGLGNIPAEAEWRMLAIGEWLKVHGEAVYGTDNGDFSEFLTHGRQTSRGSDLYLIIRFWEGKEELRVNDILGDVKRAELMTTGQELAFERRGEDLILKGLPLMKPCELFPVIKLTFEGEIGTNEWGRFRNWGGDPGRIARWAAQRGKTPWVGK